MLAVELEAILSLDDAPVEVLGWDKAEIDIILNNTAEGASSSDSAARIPIHPIFRYAHQRSVDLGGHRLRSD